MMNLDLPPTDRLKSVSINFASMRIIIAEAKRTYGARHPLSINDVDESAAIESAIKNTMGFPNSARIVSTRRHQEYLGLTFWFEDESFEELSEKYALIPLNYEYFNKEVHHGVGST